jgi:hypothetical protein
MPSPLLPTTCPRLHLVCRTCAAVFLHCVCGLLPTVIELPQCRFCTPISRKEVCNVHH